MRIFIQFSVFFVQILLTVFELAAVALLLRYHFRRNRGHHILFMLLSLLFYCIGNALVFIGTAFIVHGKPELGILLTDTFPYNVVIGSLFYGFVFINLYAKRRRRQLYAAASVLAAIALTLISSDANTAYGFQLPVSGLRYFVISYSYYLVIFITTIIVSFVAYRRKKRDRSKFARPHLALALAGLFCMVSAMAAALLLVMDMKAGTVVVYLLLIVSVGYQYIGIVSIKNPDDQKRSKPIKVITNNLVIKSLFASGLLFIVVVFALLSTVTHQYVSSVISEHELRMEDSLRNAETFLYAEINSLSMLSAAVSENMTWNHESPETILESGPISTIKNRSNFAVCLFLDDGRVFQAENETACSEWDVQQLNADDVSVFSRVSDREADVLDLASSITVIDDAGNVHGKLLIVRSLDIHGLLTCGDDRNIPISGCGFVRHDGGVLSSAGLAPDMLKVKQLLSSEGKASMARSSEHGDDEQYNKFLQSGDVAGQGVFYSYVTNGQMDQAIADTMAVVVALTMFSLIGMALLLMIAVGKFLDPISDLHRAVNRVSEGNYNFRLTNSGDDEVGKLARAFGQMTAVVRDRTERLNEKIREQRDALSHTAHEIKNPLSIFRWSLEMMQSGDLGELNPAQRELTDNMHKTNVRLRELVNDLLEVSRLDQGRVELKLEHLCFEDLVEETIHNFAPMANASGVELLWKRQSAKACHTINADRSRLAQVLTNLIGNAVKYTSSGGWVEMTLTDMEDSDDGVRRIQFCIRDNGIGIPEKDHPQIFKKFYRASNAQEQEIEGTGLGLYLCRCYIEMHGGKIWLDKNEKIGTKVCFVLPV